MENKKPQVTTFRASYENLNWLREIAAQKDRSVSWVINNAVTQARLKSEEKKEMLNE